MNYTGVAYPMNNSLSAAYLSSAPKGDVPLKPALLRYRVVHFAFTTSVLCHALQEAEAGWFPAHTSSHLQVMVQKMTPILL